MYRSTPARFAVRSAFLTACLATAFGLPGSAWALYKVVGPDGKVTYTDRAPVGQPAQALKRDGSPAEADRLPYGLQQVAVRYPVTLYTGRNCTPCDTGRAMLKARGVPFIEKTVSTAEDAKALQRAENTDSLPVLRIGSKQLQGYAQADWASYLDVAGYPAQSVLPATYQWPAPQPLAPVSGAGRTGETDRTPQSEPASNGRGASSQGNDRPASPGSGNAPPGFRF